MPEVAETPAPESLALVSHTDSKGRTLTGVGVSSESLAAVADAAEERHEPAAPVPSSPDPSATAEAPASAPKQTRGQARFSELTEARKAAEAKAEAAEARAAAAEARISAPTQPSQPHVAPPAPMQSVAGPSSRPEPNEDEIGAKYPTYFAMIADHQRWVVEQYHAQQQAEAQHREIGQKYSASVEKAKADYPDFDQAMQAPHMSAASPWHPQKIQILASQPDSARLQYALAKNPQLAEALRVETDPVRFGLLLSSALPAAPAVVPASTGRPFVPPPAPIQPVGAGSKTAAVASADLAKSPDFDSSGYREKRREERMRFARGR